MIIFPLFPCHLCNTRESLRQQIQNKHTQYVTYMCLQQGLTHLDLQAQNTPSLHCTSTGWDKASITGHHKRETETGLGSGLNRRSLFGKGSSEDEPHLQIHCHLYTVRMRVVLCCRSRAESMSWLCGFFSPHAVNSLEGWNLSREAIKDHQWNV